MDIQEQIDQKLAFLEYCNEILDKGEIVKLDDFEKDIVELCNVIQGQNPESARRYAASLSQVMNKLDTLEKKMRERQNKIKEELKSLSQQEQAQLAYAKNKKPE